MRERLVATNLAKAYGDLPVLEDVSLRLERGTSLGILGPSGCGKTTLLRILLGVETADRGRLTATLSRAGYLPQDGLLFPWKTVAANAELPLVLRQVPRAARRREVAALLRPFGLEGFAEAYPQEISGGMRQRAALLRAVLSGSDVLVLDEPFAALDVVTREGLQDWLSELVAHLESALLFVTHDPDEVTCLSARAIALSARPAVVLGEERIDLSPPERRDRLGKAFLAARDRVLRLIYGSHRDQHGRVQPI
ncbi:MAG: ABC transporter ATP-binding protein [Candidatus Bipolaricaulota bacterium]